MSNNKKQRPLTQVTIEKVKFVAREFHSLAEITETFSEEDVVKFFSISYARWLAQEGRLACKGVETEKGIKEVVQATWKALEGQLKTTTGRGKSVPDAEKSVSELQQQMALLKAMIEQKGGDVSAIIADDDEDDEDELFDEDEEEEEDEA